MNPIDISGYWTGKITGTNDGGLAFDIKQIGDELSGTAKLFEKGVGWYEYLFAGTTKDGLSFRLTPGKQSGGISLGVVRAVCVLTADGTLSGRWKSDNGLEGAFSANRQTEKSLTPAMPKSNSVFIVHGHDEGSKHAVARFLEKQGITPVILQEQINRGMTVMEKFEEFAKFAGFAIVLMTPDDEGYPVGKEEEKQKRPRQNVVLELGYFAAKLGRDKTLVLTKGKIELPSDLLGLVYEPMDGEGWKLRLA